jgi:D-aminoacyl-tRNA deacylase
MRATIQRVSKASVIADGKESGKIGKGLLVLLGVGIDDDESDIQWLVSKIAKLRIFSNSSGKFDLSLSDIKGDVLIVSQFTLYGDCKKGCRPDFTKSARPEKAKELYETFVRKMKETGLCVETGVFAADMKVELVNDGPVTLTIDSREK